MKQVNLSLSEITNNVLSIWCHQQLEDAVKLAPYLCTVAETMKNLSLILLTQRKKEEKGEKNHDHVSCML